MRDKDLDGETKRIRKLEKHASYERNKSYYKKYYQDNKDVINSRSKKRWSDLSDEERLSIYEKNRKRYRENPHDYIARVKERYENLTPKEKEKIIEKQRIRRQVKRKRRIISKGIQY